MEITKDNKFENDGKLCFVHCVMEGIMYMTNGTAFTNVEQVLELINARVG